MQKLIPTALVVDSTASTSGHGLADPVIDRAAPSVAMKAPAVALANATTAPAQLQQKIERIWTASVDSTFDAADESIS